MNFLRKKQAKKNIKSSILKGNIHTIEREYNDLLKTVTEVISTTLSNDYTKYGKEEPFILIVTYI